MQDQRRNIRARTLHRAIVGMIDGDEKIPCLIRNISEGGARLALSNAHSLPSEFTLTIVHRGQMYHARTVWRSMTEAGVEFLEALHPSSRPAPAEAPGRDWRDYPQPKYAGREEEDDVEHDQDNDAPDNDTDELENEDNYEEQDHHEEQDDYEEEGEDESGFEPPPPEPPRHRVNRSHHRQAPEPSSSPTRAVSAKAFSPESEAPSQSHNVWAELKRLELEHLKLKREMLELKSRFLALVS